MEQTESWNAVLDIFLADSPTKQVNYASLMLNHCFDPLYAITGEGENFAKSNQVKIFSRIWNQGVYRSIADGGGNYFVDLEQKFQKYCPDIELKAPDRVSGDFDSIKPDVMESFKRRPEVEIVATPDQDATDFTKALNLLAETDFSSSPLQAVVVFGSNTGRVDQFLSILHTLTIFNHSNFPPIILAILGDSISFLLKPAHCHVIPVHRAGQWCSLVPLEGAVKLTTTGFRWNLSQDVLQFEKFISTSNEFASDSDQVTIKCCDKPLLFSFDYK